jgi:hypothetical protein
LLVPSLVTQNTRLIGAPVGHRQPHARDVPSENPGDLEHIGRRTQPWIASSIFAAAVEVIG